MIEITSKYAISSEKRQWKILAHSRPSKANPTGWVAFKFFTSFGACTEALRQILIRTSEYESFAELERNVKAINRLMEKKLRSLA